MKFHVICLGQDFKSACPKEQIQNFCRPATNLLQIPISTTYNSLLCQKGQFTLQLCPRRLFVRKTFGYHPPKVKIENPSYKVFACPKGRFSGKVPH